MEGENFTPGVTGPNPPAHAGPAYDELLNMVISQGKEIAEMKKNAGKVNNAAAMGGPGHDELMTLVARQGKQLEEMKKTIAGATQLTVNKAKTKPVLPKEALNFDGESYRWRVARFSINGEFITAEEAMFDPEIISKILVIEGQGILQKLV